MQLKVSHVVVKSYHFLALQDQINPINHITNKLWVVHRVIKIEQLH